MDNKLLIIDGHSILNRAFYALPDLTNQAGEHTNAVLGFINIMLKLIDEEKPSHIIVAFDTSQPTFRHEQFSEYKGTRKAMPEELREQVPLIKETLSSMNITMIEKGGYEADDIIGTISRESTDKGYQISIISGDRDLLQLVTDNILLRIPKTKMNGTTIENYYKADVIEQYGVTPIEFIDVKGLMGDPSDNIPGVPGIGEKTATKIIQEYKSIEGALEHIDEIKPKRAKENLAAFKDQAILSKELATIKLDCQLDYDIEACRLGEVFNENSFLMFKRLEFKNLLKRFQMDIEVPKIEFEILQTSDLSEMDYHFEAAMKAETVGVSLIAEDDILGAALAYETDKVIYFSIAGMLTKDQLLERMNQLFQSRAQIIGLHLKSMFLYLNVAESTNGVFDAGVAAYLLNPLKDAYEYDDISRDYLEIMLPSKEELIGKKSYQKALEEDSQAALKAICYSAYVPFAALKVLIERLEESDMKDLYLQIEMPTTYALADMQRRGIRVNREALKEYGDNLIGRIQELEQSIYQQAGQEFNINSPKQLGVVLFEDMEIPGGKKNKTGYSTSVDVLEKLKKEYPIVNDILEYRQLTKLKSTYADGLLQYIDPKDERIHGKFHQTITATGRISSTDPNLQNIPVRLPLGRAIRKVFIPEDGYTFVDADYSQIELRILAHLSGDKTLTKAYNEGQDIHAVTASQVFNVPLDEMTPDIRRNAKAVNFGIVYGLSAFGLSEDLGISRKQATDYINSYFETYKQVKEFLDNSVEEAKQTGKVRTIFKRIRPIPELTSSNFMQRNFGERVAMNSPIQGSAADIMKIATFRVNMKLKKQNMKSRLLLQIHDELLIEASLDEVDQVKQILSEEMMGAAKLSVPLEIDINVGNNWFEAK